MYIRNLRLVFLVVICMVFLIIEFWSVFRTELLARPVGASS